MLAKAFAWIKIAVKFPKSCYMVDHRVTWWSWSLDSLVRVKIAVNRWSLVRIYSIYFKGLLTEQAG